MISGVSAATSSCGRYWPKNVSSISTPSTRLERDPAGALLIDPARTERQDVAVQLLAEPDLHLGAGLVGDVFFPDLDEPPPDDQRRDGDDQRDHVGDRLAANDRWPGRRLRAPAARG